MSDKPKTILLAAYHLPLTTYRFLMISSQTLITGISIFLAIDLIVLFFVIYKRHDVAISSEDNDFIKYNFNQACKDVQDNYLSGIKKFWNTFELVLNKKKYTGSLDEKIDKASSRFDKAMELKAMRAWTLDLADDSFIKPENVEHFVKVLRQEMVKMGVKF